MEGLILIVNKSEYWQAETILKIIYFSFFIEIYIIIKIYSVRRLLMAKKIFCISAFLVFVLLLSGCTIGLPTEPEILTDEELVIDAIENFCSSLSVKEWDLARSYCVYQAHTYNAIFKLEMDVNDLLSSECDNISITYCADISKVDILEIMQWHMVT